MRPEQLVRGARKEIATDRLDIRGAVGRMHCTSSLRVVTNLSCNEASAFHLNLLSGRPEARRTENEVKYTASGAQKTGRLTPGAE